MSAQTRQGRRASAPLSRPGRGRRSTLAGALAGLDYPLVAIVATLLALGLVMVYSASFMQAQISFGNPAYFFVRQVIWVALGIGALLVMANIPYHFWQRMALPIMGLALALLVAVLIFGEERFNARRTFRGSIQPSEFAKLAVVIYIAAWISSKGKRLAQVDAGLIPFAILMALITTLLVLEPSFSVAIIILVIGTTMFFVGGGDVKQLLITAAIGLLVLLLLLWQSGYGFQRITDWWRSLSDPQQASYQTTKVMEILRKHIGIGTNPNNWEEKILVPLLWSDYLFANVGADLGFVGTAGVVALFAAFGYRGLGIALNAPDQFGGLTAIGITTWILTQAAIHISSSLALIPATGQPLPFMSYGGSAMLACMAAVGLLLSIARVSQEKKAPYATFAFGWRNRRTRLSDPGRGQRAEGARSNQGGLIQPDGGRKGKPRRGAQGGAVGSSPASHASPRGPSRTGRRR